MKKRFSFILLMLFLLFNISGCVAEGNKSASLSTVYGTAALISLALLVVCIFTVRTKRVWFIFLFSSVFVVNVGYTLLSVSTDLQTALWANRIAYLGSVFLPLAMLMIILNVTNTVYKKLLSRALFLLAIIVFLIAASPGILPIYYKEVSFEVVNGVSTLIKVYGPLHPLFLFYLLGYFVAMVTVIVRAKKRKTVDSASHSIILAIAVFVNIGVWLIEQLTEIDFEMLSLSYIISELFLLGIHLVVTENQRLKDLVSSVEALKLSPESKGDTFDTMRGNPIDEKAFSPEKIRGYINGLDNLTVTEKAIYDAYVARVTTKEILVSFNIKESTLKFHNRNIYGKLGVSSRKELLEINKYIRAIKNNIEQ